ncbi:MAG: hypothetical protein B7Y43_13095 [Sphingomonas sp. 28-62-20]|uniref:type II toxin-antitoxin system RelE/ParE family toxin n=1 Tax=Sphingomonas sp. 28-62-20 TaxID=1970433 RepID=UPI000BD0C930|nr:MAG: hypothetical protein B7Y43_13095 [Sphingomonas sp. 28-62-20]
MRLELSRQAENDLADIRDYSVEQFELARAIGYLDAIEQGFRRIMIYPEIGIVHDTIGSPVKSLACHRHRIFYAVEDGQCSLRSLAAPASGFFASS